ncbi:Oidioi.mRNA.OKI2018_I69.chr2.g4006.t1.cds [Oikopleura dioica]|uniref:Oidioi.mRNA.OKI2018_I69.chr2.g4006.t1.cds n=1 Tax=Oikopleura dioica TaxID=34765 RepID=A0ABN7T2N6_OIKDI|nr:Oidioi.mRNA.OKI2018_I69.chr2.g4006.t1.cds [Oikopleura dioica]
MGCADFLKEWFNSDAQEWVDENYQNISIDKILKVQFSIRLSALPYNCQSLSEARIENGDSKKFTEIVTQHGSELEKSSLASLLQRFEFFEFEVIRDEETGSDAILMYAKDKPIDGVEGKTYAIATIAGTLELQDVWQDLKISQVQFEETEARVHSGFYECFQALKPKIESFIDSTLETKPVDEILIVGHSLGGAVACLVGASLAPKYENENFRVVSVAAPKIGNQALQDLFKERVKKHLRIRLVSDPIVKVLDLLYWFRHSGDDHGPTDFPLFDESDFPIGSHLPQPYYVGLEKTKQVILKKKFGNAVAKAKKFVKAK